MNYENVKYEYNIVLALNSNLNTRIKNELLKVINLIIHIIEIKLANFNLEFLCQVFFSNNIIEYGNIGTREIQTKEELEILINNLNIRELFAILKNITKNNNVNCLMFDLLINYKMDPNTFMRNYSFLNETTIKSNIKIIENMFDVDILDFSKCYDAEFNEIPCNEKNKPFYIYNNDDKTSYPKDNYNDMCQLYNPSVVSNINQLMMKKFAPSKYTDIVTKSIKKKTPSPDCLKDTLMRFPFVEPLSINERTFLSSKGINPDEPSVFNFVICNAEPNDLNLLTQIKKKYNKLSVSFTSGHSLLMIGLCDYFKDINMGLIILGCIIWLVPYNHSITEIFLAAKETNLFENYSLKKNTYESVNEFLQLYGLPLLNQLITIGDSHLKKIKRTKRQKYMRRQKTKKTLNYNK